MFQPKNRTSRHNVDLLHEHVPPSFPSQITDQLEAANSYETAKGQPFIGVCQVAYGRVLTHLINL